PTPGSRSTASRTGATSTGRPSTGVAGSTSPTSRHGASTGWSWTHSEASGWSAPIRTAPITAGTGRCRTTRGDESSAGEQRAPRPEEPCCRGALHHHDRGRVDPDGAHRPEHRDGHVPERGRHGSDQGRPADADRGRAREGVLDLLASPGPAGAATSVHRPGHGSGRPVRRGRGRALHGGASIRMVHTGRSIEMGMYLNGVGMGPIRDDRLMRIEDEHGKGFLTYWLLLDRLAPRRLYTVLVTDPGAL